MSAYIPQMKSYIFLFMLAIVCQIVIIIYWEAAKYYTILNLIVLFFGVIAYGRFHFHKMVRKEAAAVLQTDNTLPIPVLTEKAITHLPDIVQKWLHASGVVHQKKMQLVTLQQKGELRTKPNGKWMSFNASQYFNIENTSFIWSAEIQAMPFIRMYGRDKLVNGEGEMRITLAGLFSVVNEGNHHKINTGAMVRYLAEICWFPSAAVHDAIVWETVSNTSAKATFTIKNTTISGIFNFSAEGTLISFEAERFYGGDQDSKPEKWCIEMVSHTNFHGITIPNTAKVIWKLAAGDFHWLSLEITAIAYNEAKLYK